MQSSLGHGLLLITAVCFYCHFLSWSVLASNVKTYDVEDEITVDGGAHRLRRLASASDYEQLRPVNYGKLGRRWKQRRKRKANLPPSTTSKTVKPTPPLKPDVSFRKKVSWFEESHSFALQASPDSRLLIRHAPIPASGTPWPMPQHYYPEAQVFSMSEDELIFHGAGETCDILTFAFDRIRSNIFGQRANTQDRTFASFFSFRRNNPPFPEIKHVNVSVLKECPYYPSLEMDESYDLEVKRSGVSIIAREIWGALRGLETFSQLVYQDDQGRYLANRTFIHDFPRFSHRGILVDTARHFLKKETILANLEAMAQNKMNIMHWHIVDDQSFPFQSKVFPNITKMGSYDPVTHVYTHKDIAEIIEAARVRGIRVVPEFDTPGHTYSWGYGQENILTPCYDYHHMPNGYFGPLNPILKSTYFFLRKLFREVFGVYKDKYMHLGGDEVPFDCWVSHPQISNFIKRNNLTDVKDVLALYWKKLLDIVSDLGRERDAGSGYIVWQEVVDNGAKLKDDAIVQIWMGDTADIARVTDMGLRTIYSTCWYLDWINYGQDWDKYYTCDQIGAYLEDYKLRNESLLIGGEACLWTEYADNENFISRLWPRASAAAERLWSNRRVRDPVAAAPRIEEQRCRMLRRGLKVGVLSGPGYCKDYKQSQPDSKDKPAFPWEGGSVHTMRNEVDTQRPGSIYVVDMNAMYIVPLIIVVCVCCLTLLSALHVGEASKSKLVAILTSPISATSRKGVKGLLWIFIVFAFVWCIWTAPIWMNIWETAHRKRNR